MTRLTGKVVSRPIPPRKLKAGLQVLPYPGAKRVEVIECLRSGSVGFVSKHWEPSNIYLQELCVEYWPKGKAWTSSMVSLKYSQWQAAIDNGEVDTDKQVEFEIKSICSSDEAHFNANGVCDTFGNCTQCIKIARIFPKKHEKEKYDRFEVIDACSKAYIAGVQGKNFKEFIDNYLK